MKSKHVGRTCTTLYFILHIGSNRHTDGRINYAIFPLQFKSTQDRRWTYVSFHPSYLNPRQADFQTTFNFTPHSGVEDRRTNLISPFILQSTQDRRTIYVSFHPSCCRFWHTYVSFYSHIRIHVRQMDRQHLISPLIIRYTVRQTDRRTKYLHFTLHLESK